MRVGKLVNTLLYADLCISYVYKVLIGAFVVLDESERKNAECCCLRYLVGGNFYHWSRIHLSRIKVIVNGSEDHNSACHQTAEIHMRSVRINHLREEAENEDNEAIPNTKSIEFPRCREREKGPRQVR